MDLCHSSLRFSAFTSNQPLSSSKNYRRTSRLFAIRSSLPFPAEKAKYHGELQAAVNVVRLACNLCVDVQKSLFDDSSRILEKKDSSPVTVADFSVQAMISLELSKLFPSIPLVAEEDSAFLRSNNLTNAVVNVVNDIASPGDRNFTDTEVLNAIDRGGANAVAFGDSPATYWVLDPIDGTKGFLRGPDAQYVVGLALIVKGEIVLGVMGCPNWKESISSQPTSTTTEPGIIMIAHVNCGTWTLRLSDMLDGRNPLSSSWTRSSVDGCCLLHKAHICLSDSQTWDSIPIFASYTATTDANNAGEEKILLRPMCCGSLSKYVMVASGRASVFILQALSQKTIKSWDHAVGMLCVHEAGGKVTDWNGSLLDLAADEVGRRDIFPLGGVLVTNGNLHSQIVEMTSLNSALIS